MYDILERKNGFLGFKNKEFKRSKNALFPKGLTYGFGPKMAIFQTFFFRQYGPGNVFYDILEKKTPFKTIKTRSLKSPKIDTFPK